jgi:hypothetical protein
MTWEFLIAESRSQTRGTLERAYCPRRLNAITRAIGVCGVRVNANRDPVGRATRELAVVVSPRWGFGGNGMGRPLDPRPALRSDLGYRISPRWG